MILKSIEMQGFKSFPEKTVLSFGKGITAVVGPNGSGKSNISDAVRWVLGEQSSKSLRGSKMEDVIFDGTKVRKSYGFASVALRLDNSDRSVSSVDSDEICITRKYFRSGESEYKINGENVRLKDINELFMDTGLGRNGYSMVSQGRIADMVSDKGGTQCREMLEEAAGISAYRYRRNDSLKRLSQAEDNLIRLRDILSELESRIGPLKTQKEKAEKFLVLSEEKKELEISLWLYNIDKLKSELRKQDDKITVASGHYDEVEKQLKEIEEQIEKSFSSSQNITAKIEDLRQSISDTEHEISELSSRCAVLGNSQQHNAATVERIEKEKELSKQNRDQLQTEIDGEAKLVNQISEILKSKREKRAEIEQQITLLKNRGGSLDSKAGEINDKIASLTRTLSDFRVQSSTAQSQGSEIENRIETVLSLIEKRKAELEESLNSERETKKELEELTKKITSLENTVNGLNMIYSSHKEKADELRKNINTRTFDTERLLSKSKVLEELEKNMEGYSGAVKAVIKHSESGELTGIEGTVSKLISVDERYAVAVETALGGAVQNIICQNEFDAKRAIEFLKKHNLGRATFQPISSVKGRSFDERGLDEEYGFVGVASDLVDCDEKYRKIISSLLGRIAVAEDLDCAVSIAKRYSYRFKIVTLDGQVVNAGGSMTGGSQSRNAGILSRSSEIEKLKNKYSKESETLKADKDALEKLSATLEEEKKTLSQNRDELLKLGEERIRLEGKKTICRNQTASVETAIEELEKEHADCQERIILLKDSAKSMELKAVETSEKINQCQAQLTLLGEEKSEISKSSEQISSSLSKIRIEIGDAEKDLAVRTQSMNLLKARLLEDEHKDRELDDEIKNILSQGEKIKQEIAEIERNSEVLKIRIENKKKEIVSLQGQRNVCEGENTKLRQMEKDKSFERQQLSGEKVRLEERRTSMNEEYESIISKLFEEYQLSVRQAQDVAEKASDPAFSKRKLNETKSKIRSLGSVNVGAIEEYKEVSERYEFMSSQLSDVEKSKRELVKLISELTEKMSTQFREKFEAINSYFSQSFKELFGGGNAQIVLLDPTDVLESEIEIKLQPPGKNVKRLDSLSGGEKGLSAISLLFAILKVNPAPFCIFDEVEAALDDVNVTRYAKYVRTMCENTQFILITHRRGTMEEADVLYGVTMQEQGVSKLLELKTAQMAKELSLT